MTAYRDRLRWLGDTSGARLLAVYDRFLAGEFDEPATVGLFSASLARWDAKAAALALMSFTATLSRAFRRPVPAPMLPVADEAPRLAKAARTVLVTAAGSPTPEAIITRLGRSEPLQTAAVTFSDAIAASPHVVGWRRQLGSSSCQLCEWWAAGGKVWPPDHPMPTHPGCTCTQVPVIGER